MVGVADENLVNAGCRQSGRFAAPMDRLNIFTPCFLGPIHDAGEEKWHDVHSHYFALRTDLIREQARVEARAGTHIGDGLPGLQIDGLKHRHALIIHLATLALKAFHSLSNFKTRLEKVIVDARLDTLLLLRSPGIMTPEQKQTDGQPPV